MQIPPQTLTVTLTGTIPQAPGWKIGQVLDALVTRTDPVGARAEVRIGNLTVSLDLPTRVSEGSRLTLQVVRGGPQPLLTLVNPAGSAPTGVPAPNSSPVSAPGAGMPQTHTTTALLSTLLPNQGSQAPLLAALSWLTRNPGSMQILPHDVRTDLQALMRHVPGLEQAFRPEGLRQAVRESGLFHEALLATQATAARGSSSVPVANLKSVLLSLAARLRAQASTHAPPAPAATRPVDIQLPGSGQSPVPQARADANLANLGRDALLATLQTRTESALARLALHQWSSVESSDAGPPRWLLELPLRAEDGVDLVHLLLEREPERSGKDEGPTWRAELALDLPDLGPLNVQVAITGDQVQTRFWAESEDTVRRIRTALPQLRESLEDRSLRVRDLGCNPGSPPRRSEANTRGPLLDDHA